MTRYLKIVFLISSLWTPYVILLASLLLIEMLVSAGDTSPIPDHLLPRIRGSNPKTMKSISGNCTTENVNTANLSNPPPPPGTGPYVSGLGGGCRIPGSACIVCNLMSNYTIKQMQFGNVAVDPNNPQLQDCGSDNGGQLGLCTVLPNGAFECVATGVWDCYTTAIDYNAQGVPPAQ